MLYLAAAVIIVYNYTFFITICSHYRQDSVCFDKIHPNESRYHMLPAFCYKPNVKS